MDKKQEFLEVVAKYCDKDASEITEDMRFREDLGFNSLSFMTKNKSDKQKRTVSLQVIATLCAFSELFI